MKTNYFNLSLVEAEKQQIQLVNTSMSMRSVPKSFRTIKLSGNGVFDLYLDYIVSFIKEWCNHDDVRIFQIILDDCVILKESVSDKFLRLLDNLAKELDCIIVIHYVPGYKLCFLNCNYSNIILIDWNMSRSSDWNEFVRMLSVYWGMYSYLSPPLLKASILNSTVSPLSQIVRNDGSFDFQKCIYSSANRINISFGGVLAAGRPKHYVIRIPSWMKKISISATVNTVCVGSNDGFATIGFSDLPGWKSIEKENTACGNIHRARYIIQKNDNLCKNHKQFISFDCFIVKVGDEAHSGTMNFASSMFIENLLDDSSTESFYNEIIVINSK